jgi:uncharacterized protein (TIGR03067 family)
MRQLLLGCFLVCGLAPMAFGQAATQPASTSLEGTWEIISLIDNGQLVDAQTIRAKFDTDNRLVISKNMVSVDSPGRPHQVAYVLDTAGPGTVDLAGADKIGAKGIYTLNGDLLTLCFGSPESTQRPASFTSGVGGQRLLFVLHRITPPAPPQPMLPPGQEAIIGPDGKVTTVPTGSTILVLQPPAATATPAAAPTPPAPVVKPVVTPAITPTAAPVAIRREQLLGTWGHQDNEQIDTTTFNPDGTFSSSITWKPGFLRTFRQPEKRSGTWTLNDRTIVMKITASTDPKHENNQVQSWRLDRVNEYEVLYFDQDGKSRIEWKVR